MSGSNWSVVARCGALGVLLAALVLPALARAAAEGPAAAAPPALQNTWSGTWATEWGDLVISQGGASVTGSYPHDAGRLTGTLNGAGVTVGGIKPQTGRILTGRWNEAPTRTGPNDAGAIRFTLSAGGKSFVGKWTYDGSPGSWKPNWNGTCKAGACLLNADLVPVVLVSNGCGGAGWAIAEAAQNYVGNNSVYQDSNVNPLAKSYTVSFKAACDLHDAGYSGAIVRDALVDFHTWSRADVDRKFLDDMRLLCRQAIPASAKTVLANCLATGGNASIGAESRFNFVHKWGNKFFDADLTRSGTQATGHRSNA